MNAISCPACERPCPGPALQRFNAAQAAQHFVLSEEFPEQHQKLVQHIRQLWGGDGCSLLGCPACGLQFAWPFVAGDGEFYNLAYPHSDYPEQRWEFDCTLQALRQQGLHEGPVLEIGSGFGWFLRKLSPALVAPQRVRAIEYNDVARGRLRELGFTAHGVDVRSSEFDPLRGQLSALFMFQVLEHMDDFEHLLPRLAGLMRPGADVFFAVPNTDRTTWSEAHGSLLDMPPNHISRWTEPAFRAVGARLGWQLQSYQVQPMSWPALIRLDLVYAHMRRAQNRGSLANRIRGRRRTRARVVMEGAAALLAAPTRVPAWVAAARSARSLGDSVWVHFKAGGGA